MKNKEYKINLELLSESIALLCIAKFKSEIFRKKRDILYEELLKVLQYEKN